jgi:hypothetical protein
MFVWGAAAEASAECGIQKARNGGMERLRGRNLSHIGCTLGLVLGLTLGLVVAWAIARVSPSIGLAFAVFAAVTVALGIAGFIAGSVATRRLWGESAPRQ